MVCLEFLWKVSCALNTIGFNSFVLRSLLALRFGGLLGLWLLGLFIGFNELLVVYWFSLFCILVFSFPGNRTLSFVFGTLYFVS